ncbi:MAG: YdiU family protein [Planctomycetota bacterium]
MKKLEQLTFANWFVDQLPGDPDLTNSRRPVHGACYSRVHPKRAPAPQLIGWSDEVAELIGLDQTEFQTERFANVFAGNELLDGMDPYAMCYGGHQFGHWAGQLGDGRAINLGSVQHGEGAPWTLQLKGAGPTPYSRTADGLAVLRSSIREFLCSEAMYHLGVPTTRALSLVLTGDQVLRDMFYDGNAAYEPGAIVCRVAPSFLRFGNYQLFAARGDHETLKRLVDFTIENYFSDLGPPSPEVYAEWFQRVCRLTCEMMVHWMRVGFVHGVMNTDNMSILGLTIDYGPYGWLEGYDPGWTPNTTDAEGKRYRFGNQPLVAHWNLYQLGNAILPLVEGTEALQAGLDSYLVEIEKGSNAMIASKLGFQQWRESDQSLKEDLFALLTAEETDMTIFYRRLAQLSCEQDQEDDRLIDTVRPAYYLPEKIDGEFRQQLIDWLKRYRIRIREDGQSDAQREDQMNRVNPKYVFRNYLAQLAIDKSVAGDYSMVMDLLEVLRRPYDEQPDKEEFAEKRPEWARTRAGCSMLSCSS